jgi:pimeloyl-ACP methyl ester carboxylesterase
MNHLKTVIICCCLMASTSACSTNQKSVAKKYLNYKEHKIYYEVRGHSAKTLIFIHGWASSVQSWKYQLDSFPDYQVVAVDLPGNGKSSKNEKSSYSPGLFADSVFQVLKKEKIAKGFFIGHSMGFSVCEVIVQKYPELCTGICSMDGAHFELPENPKEKAKWFQDNRSFANTMVSESGRANFLSMLFLPDTPKMLKNEVFKISKTVPLVIGKSMIDGVEKDQKFWKKRKTELPLLAIYSPAYQLPPDYEEQLKKVYPNVEYHYIPAVSHFLMLEIPYKINQIIDDFLLKYY